MRDPGERLQDILEAVAAIARYLARGKVPFQRDELLQGRFRVPLRGPGILGCRPFLKRHRSAKVEIGLFHQPGEATEMKIATLGINLAKNVIRVHGSMSEAR